MNNYLLVSFSTLILCQILKFCIESIKFKTLKWTRILTASGGMPSSHTSFSTSLTLTIGLQEGFSTPLFAVALVFTCIVIFDAMGVRLESEKQAEAINSIVKKLFKKPNKEGFMVLKEELGHEPIEVFFGLLLGILMALLFNKFA